MLHDPAFWILVVIVGIAFAVEATTGFGATVIAVTLGVHLFPLDELLPVIVPLGLFLSATIAWRERAHIDWPLLTKTILPLMGIGLLIGIAIFERASNEALRRVFGLFVVILSALELWRRWAAPKQPPEPLPPLRTGATIVGAGVIHGLFSSGGPLLVYALSRAQIPKRRFRATLSTVWLVMGSALSIAYSLNGHLDAGTLETTAALLPVLAVAWLAGDWLHHRLDEERFRVLVYGLLLIAGLTNLF